MGIEGQCANIEEGKTCVFPHCDAGTFEFVSEHVCLSDTCTPTATPVSCFDNNECTLDLCGDTGCEYVLVLDGTACGKPGNACFDGVCAPDSSAAGGGVGMGGMSGTGGDGADDNNAEDGEGGFPLLPPNPDADSGCGCRTVGMPSRSARYGWLLLALSAAAIRIRRSAKSS